MGDLTSLLHSDVGKIIGGLFIMVGVSDIAVAYVVFRQRMEQVESGISPSWSPEKAGPFRRKLAGLRIAFSTLKLTGFLLLLAGLYLVTR